MQSDPLQQLRDVHLPADPSWWPPAIGWWLAAAILAALLTALYRRARRMYLAALPRRAAIRLLRDLRQQYEQQQIDDAQYLHASNEILKRLLVRGYGKQSLAALSGDAWLAALDELDNTDNFTCGVGSALGQARFSPQASVNVSALHQCLERLIRRTRP